MYNAQILIVDEHRLVSAGLQSLLLMNGFNHVSIANTINEGINAVTHQRIDILILDPEFNENNGIAFLRDIVKSRPRIKTILLSQSKNEHLIMQSVIQGTNGFVSKHDNIKSLIAAISCVYNSVNYLPEEILKRTNYYLEEQRRLTRLTAREALILRQLAQGKTNKIIANEMGLSNKTISTYKTKIFQKLETRNLVNVIEIAKRNGAC
ncbi:response regulator transcription factor [[Erwinia] mediterraneensis]|uniref:response regulator transcription factor n=1 Tax=[Erwinia] mediterraneensis TaxID=2161819 RepID=UPI001030D3A6|nr:response regulator transcription factor [[Erwinia] mediterraneensis]